MFLFGRKRMVAAPEGAPAGGSGGGAAAPQSGVSGPASPAGGGSTPFPRLFGGGGSEKPSGDAGGGDEDPDELADLETAHAGGQDNPIPYSRVKKILEGRTAKAQRAAKEEALREARDGFLREFAPVLEELQSLRQLREQFDPDKVKLGVAEAFLESLGVKKEKPAPKYLTEEDFNRRLTEQETKFQREHQHREELQRAKLDLGAAKQRHEKVFKHFPAMEELAAAVWSTPAAVKHGISMAQVCDALAAQLQSFVGAYNDAYAKGKEEDAKETVITPGSTATPGKKSPAKVDHSTEGTAKRAVAFLEKALG
jgi:hypothetical protein